MKNISFLFCLTVFLSFQSFAQNNAADSSKLKLSQIKQKFFGNIFTGFYYGLNSNIAPRQAFELSTALFGYSAELNEKVKATLIYDVTKTTGDIKVRDTSNNGQMDVSFFKGSDYTAFLKQAQIDWKFTDNFELSVGQLLNQQYLTLQDKFWGYRYVAYTFQERYKFGSPADFGARISFHLKEKLNLSIGAVNGDGAFYRQDSKGIMLYSANLEYFPVKNLTLKFYYDISPYKNSPARMAYSGFVGYKTEKWRLGIEYNNLTHVNFIPESIYRGVSAYGSIKLYEKFELLARYDYIEKSATYSESHYALLGIQYQPVKNFFVSLNGRELLPADEPQVYLNFGIKF